MDHLLRGRADDAAGRAHHGRRQLGSRRSRPPPPRSARPHQTSGSSPTHSRARASSASSTIRRTPACDAWRRRPRATPPGNDATPATKNAYSSGSHSFHSQTPTPSSSSCSNSKPACKPRWNPHRSAKQPLHSSHSPRSARITLATPRPRCSGSPTQADNRRTSAPALLFSLPARAPRCRRSPPCNARQAGPAGGQPPRTQAERGSDCSERPLTPFDDSAASHSGNLGRTSRGAWGDGPALSSGRTARNLARLPLPSALFSPRRSFTSGQDGSSSRERRSSM